MKLLIVRLSSLGDVIHTIPAQQQIADHLGQAEIHWVTEPPFDSLLHHIPGISRLWVADTRKWRRRISGLREMLQLVSSLRGERFDIALDFQGLAKSAVMARLSGATQVVGLPSRELREPVATWFYTDIARAADRSLSSPGESNRRHVVEINLELARFVGCSKGSSALIPLRIPPQATRCVKEKLHGLGMTHPILINPGAGKAKKLWGARHYANLFLEIRKRLGLPAMFTYGPGEEHLIDEIQRVIEPLPVPTFATNLLELAALCRQSRLLVAGDTGPLHLAVALGTPTVALMGPTSLWRNGPFHPDDQVVTTNRRSSGRRAWKRPGSMDDIRVEEVFGAVVRRLELVKATSHCH